MTDPKDILFNVEKYDDHITDKVAIDNSTSTKVESINLKQLSQIHFIEEISQCIEDDNNTEPYLLSYYKYADDFINAKIELEPILSKKNERFTIHPIQYHTIWANYKQQQKLDWVADEVDLSKDVDHWENKLSENDRVFIMHVLAFFSSADGIVNLNLKKNLMDVITIKEAECAYSKQFQMENVHGEMYSLMIETFIKDPELKQKLIDSVKTMAAIKKKAQWYREWIDSDKPFVHKLIASAIVEGVFFSGSFASIFWLKARSGSIMPGLRKSNKFIAKDENKHVELACLIKEHLKNIPKESVVYQIIGDAVDIEDEFINDALKCRLLGMNAKLMSQYIRYVADRLLVQLGYRKKYNAENPFEFMKKIDSYAKENMFEGRIDEYSNAKIDNPKVFTILDKY